jgi:glucosamine--fructose-6-phosphate aminotransferase (isomerizing)
MELNHYTYDILTQPDALRKAIAGFDPSLFKPLVNAIASQKIDRIILTGMGASYYAAYPASLILARSRLPVIWMDASELIHYGRPLLSERALLWIVSQSGRSAEALSLLDWAREYPPAALLAVSNDPQSPLAQAASLVLWLNAEPEKTVSTRTYLNTLALGQLAALRLVGADLGLHLDDLHATAAAMQIYLESWQAHLERIASLVGKPERLVLLGRGASLTSSYCGALVIEEAAKFPAMAFQAAEFRHGPLEMARPDLDILIFAGPPETRALNLRLFDDLRRCDAHPLWIDPLDGKTPASPEIPSVARLPMPEGRGVGLPIAEILPIQLLSLHLGRISGIEPGKFLHIGKVTTQE